MGSYTFRWPYKADEVFVTGTFDDWGKTVKLDKKGDIFEKHVELPSTDQKLHYKFVVDGIWTTDSNVAEEDDGDNNINNVLNPDQFNSSHQNGAAVMAGVTPESTTAALAAGVPKESEKNAPENALHGATISSAAPESSTAELAGQAALEQSGELPGSFPETPSKEPEQFSVSPIPASSGVGNPIQLKPGEKVPDSSTFNSNTVESTVDKDGYSKDASAAFAEQSGSGEAGEFSVNPIPASSGIGNPIHLKPGEKVPDSSTFNSNTVESTVDKDGYNKDAGDEAKQFSVNPIPASSGIGNPIHLKPGEKVPDSSTFNSNTVESTVDKEGYGKDASAAYGTQNETGTLGVPPTSSKNIIPESGLPQGESNFGVNTIQSAGPASTTAALAAGVPLKSEKQKSTQGPVDDVPDRVKKSIEEAREPPEATANQSVVDEKKEVEDELQKSVERKESAGATGPTVTAATTESAPTATGPPADSRPLSPCSTPPPEPGAEETKAPQTSGPERAAATTAPQNGKATNGTTHTEPQRTSTSNGTNGTNGTNGSKESPKKKRRSRMSGFFEKIKEKLK